MLYAWIDIAKLNHFAADLSSDDEIFIEPSKFTNEGYGFQIPASKRKAFDKEDLIIGLESTAHYDDSPVRYRAASFCKMYILNPIKTSTIRKNNIRKTNADHDSVIVPVPCIGSINWGMILGEIGDIHRFPNPTSSLLMPV